MSSNAGFIKVVANEPQHSSAILDHAALVMQVLHIFISHFNTDTMQLSSCQLLPTVVFGLVDKPMQIRLAIL